MPNTLELPALIDFAEKRPDQVFGVGCSFCFAAQCATTMTGRHHEMWGYTEFDTFKSDDAEFDTVDKRFAHLCRDLTHDPDYRGRATGAQLGRMLKMLAIGTHPRDVVERCRP